MLMLWWTLAAEAGDCLENPMLRQGVTQVRDMTNGKGKPTGRTITTVKKVSGGADAATSEVHVDQFDKKGKPVQATDYGVACQQGNLKIDMRAFWPAEATQPYRDWDMTVLAEELSYPNEPVVGEELPSAKLAINFVMKDAVGMPPVTLAVSIRDRTVAAEEPVTTPIGTHPAWKLTSQQEIVTTSIAPITVRFDVVEWYVSGTGVVKTETWRKGKLVGTTTLMESR